MTGADLHRRDVLALLAAAATAPALSSSTARAALPPPLPMTGVNLAGAEFGHKAPGAIGVDYAYPPLDMISAYADLGFNTIRLPFRWERLEPVLGRPWNEAEWRAIAEILSHAAERRLRIVLDVHNYARRRVVTDGYREDHLIGSDAVPSAAFASFWAQLAERAAPDPNVVLGLMNEPHGVAPETWLAIANETIAAIRATGVGNLILAPGVAWTGAHSWHRERNTVMEGLDDPAGALALDVHQYVDVDASGTSGDAVSSTIGSERLEAFQEWARARGVKAFLGEFGAGPGPTAVAALEDMLIEMTANADIWLGWTGWAGGPWWRDDYPLRLDRRADGRWPPQTLAMRRYARKSLDRGWATPGGVVDVDFARGRADGVASPLAIISVRRASAAIAPRRDGGLVHVAAHQPRIGDLGLRIDAAGENLLDAAAFDAAARAIGRAAPASVAGDAAVVIDVGAPPIAPTLTLALRRRFAAPGLASIAFHTRADPRLGVEIDLLLDGERVVYDLGAMTAHALTGGVRAAISASGAWRRVEATWRAPTAPAIRLSISQRKAAAGREHPEPAAVALWRPSVEQSDAATMFAASTRASDDVDLSGPLPGLFASGEATILIETRDLPMSETPRPLLSLGDVLLLGRTGDGALETRLGAGAVTGRRPLRKWRARHRSAISISRRAGAVFIATTGEPAIETALVGAELSGAPSLGAEPPSEGARRLGGCVTRIAAFDRALSSDALEALVA